MKQRWAKAAGTLFGAALLLAGYEVIPVPLGGLGDIVPKPTALAKFKKSGCGVGSLDKASVTAFYGKVATDPAIRLAIDQELVGQGFTRSFEAGDTLYRKSAFNLMWVTSSVRVQGSGTVICSAFRRKWPWRS